MFNNNSNRKLLLDSDQQSQNSFDSSEVYSLQSRTASIDSNFTLSKQQALLSTPLIKIHFTDEDFSNQNQKTQSIQKPRIEVKSIQPFFQQQVPFQLGFVVGKKKKNAHFNQSKLKKVENFFQDDETTFNFNQEELFPNNTLMQFPPLRPTRQYQEEIPEFSIPCFKNVGKKNTISINKDLLQKAKNFFNDDTQQMITDMSFQKPTKVKRLNQLSESKQANFIKTVNANKNRKKQQTKKAVIKKQIFDWNKFELSSKKMVQSNNIQNLKQQNQQKTKSRKKRISKQHDLKKSFFKLLSLKDLKISQYQNFQKRQEFQNKLQKEAYFDTFMHQTQNCSIPKCLLCNLKVEQIKLDIDALQAIFSSKLIFQKLSQQTFNQLYYQIAFKLLKYSTFFPQIINKQFNPSNILIQMHKRAKIIQKQTPSNGWIDFCMKQNKFYHSFVAQVKDIYHNQKIKIYFIKFSDGWTNIWAIVPQRNYLYQFISKLSILKKIFVGFWKFYPLSNILNFCPNSKVGEKCIEIWYNSSIIVQQNMKIGKSPQNMIFYRPLNLNRKQGGIIPTVQGTIIRMFSLPYTPVKKKSSNDPNEKTFAQNFVEIITPEGITALIKFILPTDRSLAQLFRLYYKYHFYFLKINSKDNILQFNDEYSKFFEFDKSQKNLYEPSLIQIIKLRYINEMRELKIQKKLKIGKLYDFRLQNNTQKDKNKYCSFIRGYKFVIQSDASQVIGEHSHSLFKGSNVSLYQQYRLQRIQKQMSKQTEKGFQQQSKQKLVFIMKKQKYSNTLRSLPALYEKLNQFCS